MPIRMSRAVVQHFRPTAILFRRFERRPATDNAAVVHIQWTGELVQQRIVAAGSVRGSGQSMGPGSQDSHWGPMHTKRPSASERNSMPLAAARPSHAGGASSAYSANFSPVDADAAHRVPPILPS